jgi:hypothetical protein
MQQSPSTHTDPCAAQSPAEAHATQVLDARSHTGVRLAQCRLSVQATHWCRSTSHAGLAPPHWESETQATQRFETGSQCGSDPPLQSPSSRQAGQYGWSCGDALRPVCKSKDWQPCWHCPAGEADQHVPPGP